MKQIQKAFNGTFSFYYLDDKVVIIMTRVTQRFKVSLFKTFDEEAVKRVELNYAYPKVFIDLLQLDSRRLNDNTLYLCLTLI
ncbi:MAG: hypothetical protein IJ656_03585 [Bacilli bacterium]|nr:hypothetical protein [Bacilli bacterium]